MMLTPASGRQPAARLLTWPGHEHLVVRAGLDRRHGGRRHRPGNHRRHVGGPARGRARVRARPVLQAGIGRPRRATRARHHAAGRGGRGGQGRGRRDPRPGVAQRLPAGRAGRPQPVGRAAQAPRPVRQYPARAQPRRLSAALRFARRPRDRAREYRGFLRRPLHVPRLRRVHAHAGPRALRAQDHARGLDADRRSGFCARPAAPRQGDGGTQGQRAAGLGRAVSRMRARGGGALPRRRL